MLSVACESQCKCQYQHKGHSGHSPSRDTLQAQTTQGAKLRNFLPASSCNSEEWGSKRVTYFDLQVLIIILLYTFTMISSPGTKCKMTREASNVTSGVEVLIYSPCCSYGQHRVSQHKVILGALRMLWWPWLAPLDTSTYLFYPSNTSFSMPLQHVGQLGLGGDFVFDSQFLINQNCAHSTAELSQPSQIVRNWRCF